MNEFKKANLITNQLFKETVPIQVFHREAEQTDYVPDITFQNKHILFRKKFTINEFEKVELSISADDYYKLYINGKFVTQGPAPSFSFHYYYNKIDITDYIHQGENTIAVHTYYQGLINRVWVSGDLRHMLICEVTNGQQPIIKNIIEEVAIYEREDSILDGISDKWNMVDWPVNLRDDYDFMLTRPIGKGGISVINAFYYGAICAYEQINDILQIPYHSPKEKLRKAFIDTFYIEESGLFVDSDTSKHSSLHANILPLLFQIKPDSNQTLVHFLEKKGIASCGVYMALFYLMALKNVGATDVMYQQIKNKDAWLNMIAEGATTCFEVWNKDGKFNTSLFHPWATAPIIALTDTRFPL